MHNFRVNNEKQKKADKLRTRLIRFLNLQELIARMTGASVLFGF